jgi:hypothetical protein
MKPRASDPDRPAVGVPLPARSNTKDMTTCFPKVLYKRRARFEQAVGKQTIQTHRRYERAVVLRRLLASK